MLSYHAAVNTHPGSQRQVHGFFKSLPVVRNNFHKMVSFHSSHLILHDTKTYDDISTSPTRRLPAQRWGPASSPGSGRRWHSCPPGLRPSRPCPREVAPSCPRGQPWGPFRRALATIFKLTNREGLTSMGSTPCPMLWSVFKGPLSEEPSPLRGMV